MQLKSTALITAILGLSLTLQAETSQFDSQAPFGFATCNSRTDANPSANNITGGGAYTYAEALALKEAGSKKVIILTSTGSNMASAISSAISNNDIIIFDGSAGDFILKNYVEVKSKQNKTLLGINNARLCTEWHATAEDIAALNEAGVKNMSTSSGTGGKLSNGTSVSEEAEYHTRQIMIDRYGTTNEWWRKSGIFYISGCKNLILRNITFCGPGAMDLGGADLVSIINSTNHVWVDHCDFLDGQDGNMDITQMSDFVTVSWSTFSYTERSYMHQNTNLCGSSDSNTADDDKLNITWAYNQWGKGCQARMPMARFGRFHMLNNYFNCAGNGSACINPRKNSEFLIEGNNFDAGVKKVYAASDATKVIWRSNNYVGYGSAASQFSAVKDDNTAATSLIPYTYPTDMTASQVPAEVGKHAGATLLFDTNDLYAIPTCAHTDANIYNLSGQRCNNASGFQICNGKLRLVK